MHGSTNNGNDYDKSKDCWAVKFCSVVQGPGAERVSVCAVIELRRSAGPRPWGWTFLITSFWNYVSFVSILGVRVGRFAYCVEIYIRLLQGEFSGMGQLVGMELLRPNPYVTSRGTQVIWLYAANNPWKPSEFDHEQCTHGEIRMIFEVKNYKIDGCQAMFLTWYSRGHYLKQFSIPYQ